MLVRYRLERQQPLGTEASAAVAQQGNHQLVQRLLLPAEYDYTIMQFTPNIDIGSTDVKYDIILEADTFPKPDTVGAAAVHSCPVGSKTVAQITGRHILL